MLVKELMRRFRPSLNMLCSNMTPFANWEEVRVIDRATKNHELKIKEALHIKMTPEPGSLCCM